jgi:sugar lactone lactonase YvrE
MNDGACDAAGRFWAGTLTNDARPGSGTLYRLDADGSVVTAVEGLTISNGIAWSSDNRTMYLIDSATYRVDAFDFDLEFGALSGRRSVITIDPADGIPDGLAVDAEGHLWVALWDGWAVRRYTSDGVGERELRLPVARVTSVAFGGAHLDDLYVTSAWDGLPDGERAEQPAAGGLFRWHSKIPGLSPSPFAG